MTLRVEKINPNRRPLEGEFPAGYRHEEEPHAPTSPHSCPCSTIGRFLRGPPRRLRSSYDELHNNSGQQSNGNFRALAHILPCTISVIIEHAKGNAGRAGRARLSRNLLLRAKGRRAGVAGSVLVSLLHLGHAVKVAGDLALNVLAMRQSGRRMLLG